MKGCCSAPRSLIFLTDETLAFPCEFLKHPALETQSTRRSNPGPYSSLSNSSSNVEQVVGTIGYPRSSRILTCSGLTPSPINRAGILLNSGNVLNNLMNHGARK